MNIEQLLASAKQPAPAKGITFLEGLTILFLGLKLSGAAALSWWLVFLPLYGPFILAGFFFSISALIRCFRKKK